MRKKNKYKTEKICVLKILAMKMHNNLKIEQ